MLSVTKIFHFEAAHAISWHKGKCRNVHGHSYELHVSVAADDLDPSEMVIDFTELKKIVKEQVINRLDHTLILCKTGELATEFASHGGRMMWTDREPTVEYMLLLISDWIKPHLPEGVQLNRLQLWETKSSYAQLD